MKSKLQSLKKKLDRLIQEKYVPINPRCLVCGEKTNCMHHFIQKSQSLFLRWDVRNLVPLCSKCHCKHHVTGDPAIVESIIFQKGFAWFDELERDRRKVFKVNVAILKEMIEQERF